MMALVCLAIVGTSVVAEQEEVEAPANDDAFVSLINEVVKKATILRVKRNNAGFSDLGESNEEEHEVDEEMAAAGLDSKSCIAKAAHCTTKAGTCKGSLATCDEAVQSCVTAARDCKVSSKRGKEQDRQPEKIDNKAQVSDTDKQLQEGDDNPQQDVTATEETQQSLHHSERSPSSVQDGQPEVLDEDFDQDKLEKDELSHEEGTEKQISQEAVAGSNEAAQISSPEETNLAEQALALLEEDEDEGDAVYGSDDESDDSGLDGAPVFEHQEELANVHWDTEDSDVEEAQDKESHDEEAQDDLGEDQDDLQTTSASETDQDAHEDLGEDQDDLQTLSDNEADEDDDDGEYLVYDVDYNADEKE